MTLQQAIWEWFKYKKTSDYQYVQVAISPYLHGSETLWTMHRNAVSDKQRECILEHLERFSEITMKYSDYRRLYNKLKGE